jgi:hypothetical protein
MIEDFPCGVCFRLVEDSFNSPDDPRVRVSIFDHIATHEIDWTTLRHMERLHAMAEHTLMLREVATR